MSWLVLAVVLAGQPATTHVGLASHPGSACCVIADLAEPGDLLPSPSSTAHVDTAVVVPRAVVSVAPVRGRPASRPTVHRIPPESSDDEPPQRSA
jgi:hypothetical protein